MKRIARIISIVLVLGVGAYLAYSHFEGKVKEKAEQNAEKERLRKSDRASIIKMVSKYGAINDWKKKLSESGIDRRILTMELQRLWLTDRPILFKGYIKDITTHDNDFYSMFLNDHTGPLFDTKLALSLECPKTMIDSFLAAIPVAARKYLIHVAVIGKIAKIESSSTITEADGEAEKKIGFGQCLAILYRDEYAQEDDEL